MSKSISLSFILFFFINPVVNSQEVYTDINMERSELIKISHQTYYYEESPLLERYEKYLAIKPLDYFIWFDFLSLKSLKLMSSYSILQRLLSQRESKGVDVHDADYISLMGLKLFLELYILPENEFNINKRHYLALENSKYIRKIYNHILLPTSLEGDCPDYDLWRGIKKDDIEGKSFTDSWKPLGYLTRSHFHFTYFSECKNQSDDYYNPLKKTRDEESNLFFLVILTQIIETDRFFFYYQDNTKMFSDYLRLLKLTETSFTPQWIKNELLYRIGVICQSENNLCNSSERALFLDENLFGQKNSYLFKLLENQIKLRSIKNKALAE